MGLFKRRDTTPSGERAKVAFADGLPTEELLDRALDAVAGIMRDLAAHSFDIGQGEHSEFTRRCEAWARHILTCVPLQQGEGDDDAPDAASTPGKNAEQATPPSSTTPVVRDFVGLRQFHRDRRREEERYVRQRLKDFKGLIWELVNGLRSIAVEGRSAEANILRNLSTLQKATEAPSIETLRLAVNDTIGTVRTTLADQRKAFASQLQRMGSRLSSMRNELVEARRQMQQDPLTSLYNRRAFDTALGQYLDIAQLSGQPLVLLMVDLDHFKAVNDTYGHPAGDHVLTEASGRLLRAFPRRNDFVARYGGEEFATLLLDAGADDAPMLAERLLESFRQRPFTLQNGKELEVTCSVGYASVALEDSADTLVARADRALYQAKQNGRNRAEQATLDPAERRGDSSPR